MTNQMRIIYLCAMLGVLAIWMAGVAYMESQKIEVDRGFLTTISGVCAVVINQILGNLFNSKDNHDTTKKVIEEIQHGQGN